MPQIEAETILAPDGPIARRVGGSFESRPEQTEMARAVSVAMEERSRLLVEAGTGVGKSFAYLVPAILRCVLHHEKVVIATATISLQEQLINKDIPVLMETLAEWGLGSGAAELKPVLAKGRGNYLSVRRLKLASSRQESLLSEHDQRHSLHVIEDWAYTTPDGSLSTLPALSRPDVWDHVRSDTDNCMGRKCQHYKECFYQSARRSIEQANLIICNHALFFADLALRTQGVAAATGAGGAILPNYHHVVFDEAHNIEETAAGHFGLSLSEPRVRRLLRTLYSARRRKGYLSERALALADTEAVDRAIMLVIRAEDQVRRFFDQLLEFHRSGRSPSGRIRPSDADCFDNTLTPVMRDLAIRLRILRDAVKTDQDRFELTSFAKRASDIADAAEALLAQALVVPKEPEKGNTEREPEDEPRFVAEEDERRWDEGADGGESDAESDARRAMNPYVYWVEVERDGPRGAQQNGGGAAESVDFASAAEGEAESSESGSGGDGGGMGDSGGTSSGWSGAGGMGGGGGRGYGGGSASSRFGPRVTLSCAPVDVAPILRRVLFDPAVRIAEMPVDEGGEAEGREAAGKMEASFRPSIVLTSATLATRTSAKGEHTERAETAFAHVINSLGLPPPPQTKTLQLGSPFDYAKQVEFYVDLTVPNPRGGGGGGGGSRTGTVDPYTRALAQRVEHHVRATDGGAFVLFTSFATLNAVADRLRPTLERLGMPLLCHGRDGARTQILQRFLDSERSVLFGAASFWQGVDVRGERLRNVIIVRLPFDPPDRPVTQARLERLELLGVNPFAMDSLPRAIIKFKQGFGRLIRSKSDKGRVVVLDPRVVTTGYGRSFIQALPPGVQVRRIEHDPDVF